MPSQTNIDSVLTETRVFEPSNEFRSHAHIGSLAEYERLYREAEQNPAQFWGAIASELHWFKPWDQVLEWNCPWAKWFLGGQINLSYNCLDRHVATWRRNKAALIWEGEPGEVQTLTYQQLLTEVSKFEKLRLALGDHVETGRERYGLTWAGKADAMRAVQIPSTATLVPVRAESVDWDRS